VKQALHILRKDFDYVRIEVAIFVLLAAAFAWMKLHVQNDEWSDPVLALAAAYLIARSVHADGIPGDRQFWLTRPYSRKSLLFAKLLFVAVCVSLPVALAELTVALRAGFDLKETIGPLLLSQALLFVFGALPILGLAALTTGIIPFIVIALALTLLWMGGSSAVEFWFPAYAYSIPGPVEWIRSTMFSVPIVVVTIIAIVWQYRSRATNSSRILAIAGLNVAALLFLFIPASFALQTQSWFSKKPDLASGITITARHQDRYTAALVKFAEGEMMEVPFVIEVDHLPPNVEVRADDLVISGSLNGLEFNQLRQPGIERRSQQDDRATFEVTMIVSPRLFQSDGYVPLKLKGSLYLTLFGDDENSLVSLRARAAPAPSGLRCTMTQMTDRARSVPPPPGAEQEWHPADSIVCRSLFQWPGKLVYAQSGEHLADFSNTRISYAPFNVGFSLTPFETRWSVPVDSDTVTLITRKPLVHFRRDFELKNVTLADFEARR